MHSFKFYSCVVSLKRWLIEWISYLKVPCKIAKVKKGSPASTSNRGISGSNVPAASCGVKPSTIVLPKVTSVQRSDEVFPKSTSVQRSGEAAPSSVVIPVPCNMDESPSKSDGDSVSMDETMSTCDSFKSPQVEYIDNNDVQAIDSINRKTFSHLHISDQPETTGSIFEQTFEISCAAVHFTCVLSFHGLKRLQFCFNLWYNG